jgi:hypothetical protein
LTSANDWDREGLGTSVTRPEDEQWWADRIAAQAAERERAKQGPGDQPRASGGRPQGVRSAWAALGGGLSGDQSGGIGGDPNSGFAPQYRSALGGLSFLENEDAARSGLVLLILSVIAGIGAALSVLLLAVIVGAVVGVL